MSAERQPGCANLWDDPGLQAWGTAPQARFVIALEQPGSWGGHALVESQLAPELGQALGEVTRAAGGLSVLIRAPGRGTEESSSTRTVLVAGGMAGSPWLVRATVDEPEAVLALPFDAFANDDSGALLAAIPGSKTERAAVLVCTNGKRDACCAIRGRPVAAAAAETRPGMVWETTHLSGHRFAPTALVLPTGQALARVQPSLLVDALDAAAVGQIGVAGLHRFHFRGLMCLPPDRQVADAAVRIASGEVRPRTLRVTGNTGGALEVEHLDGRAWQVRVKLERVEGDRPKSCGDPAEPTLVWSATADRDGDLLP